MQALLSQRSPGKNTLPYCLIAINDFKGYNFPIYGGPSNVVRYTVNPHANNAKQALDGICTDIIAGHQHAGMVLIVGNTRILWKIGGRLFAQKADLTHNVILLTDTAIPKEEEGPSLDLSNLLALSERQVSKINYLEPTGLLPWASICLVEKGTTQPIPID